MIKYNVPSAAGPIWKCTKTTHWFTGTIRVIHLSPKISDPKGFVSRDPVTKHVFFPASWRLNFSISQGIWIFSSLRARWWQSSTLCRSTGAGCSAAVWNDESGEVGWWAQSSDSADCPETILFSQNLLVFWILKTEDLKRQWMVKEFTFSKKSSLIKHRSSAVHPGFCRFGCLTYCTLLISWTVTYGANLELFINPKKWPKLHLWNGWRFSMVRLILQVHPSLWFQTDILSAWLL